MSSWNRRGPPSWTFQFWSSGSRYGDKIFVSGLGLTRDPYRRTDEANMGVNIGMQRFHLPRRGRVTPPFFGEIGLILPDIKIVLARLNRIEHNGKFEGTAYEILAVQNNFIYLKSPWGIPMRLWNSGAQLFRGPNGVNLCWYSRSTWHSKETDQILPRIIEAPVLIDKINGENAAICTVGPHQYPRFIEREIGNYNLYDFHVAYNITNYNEARDIAASHGKIKREGTGQGCFVDGPFDSKTVFNGWYEDILYGSTLPFQYVKHLYNLFDPKVEYWYF